MGFGIRSHADPDTRQAGDSPRTAVKHRGGTLAFLGNGDMTPHSRVLHRRSTYLSASEMVQFTWSAKDSKSLREQRILRSAANRPPWEAPMTTTSVRTRFAERPRRAVGRHQARRHRDHLRGSAVDVVAVARPDTSGSVPCSPKASSGATSSRSSTRTHRPAWRSRSARPRSARSTRW